MDHYTLRRVAAEIENVVKKEDNVSITTLIGGYRRQVEIRIDPARLAAFHLDAGTIARMLQGSNRESRSGSYPSPEGEIVLHTKGFLRDAEDVGRVVVGYSKIGLCIWVRWRRSETARRTRPVRFPGAGPAAAEKGIHADKASGSVYPAVTLSIAKRKGTNAISVAEEILRRVEESRGTVIPGNIHVTITRHYGETAKEKSDELLLHMFIAVFSVTVLISLTLGRREAGVVALAIPVTLALTLAVFYLYGYTLNRITLFALIFSIGILVDDAIVVVENVVRHFRLPANKDRPFREVAVEAVDEVGNPTILATSP